MRYILAAIAGVWMADGLALLVAPRRVVERVREVLTLSPTILQWEGVGACLGILLLLGTSGLRYQPLWLIAGAVMVIKGLFFALGPDRLRRELMDWCLRRDEVDYRFWGLGLCALALLLLHAVGWLGAPVTDP